MRIIQDEKVACSLCKEIYLGLNSLVEVYFGASKIYGGSVCKKCRGRFQ
jgi:hypothetical protein